MNRPVIAIITLAALSAVASGEEEFFDQLDQTLSVSTSDGAFRARLSGTLDLEGYHFSQPAPALIDADGSTLFNPRLSLFLDAQLGSHFYLFAQARVAAASIPSRRNSRAGSMNMRCGLRRGSTAGSMCKSENSRR